ncbi:hypothetical protein FACS1894154_08160 [Betaproteobacteria bacterium]|nr:hypothetical protein FACS1894154_08160 [Betaproteobacteria bacterium]
MYFVLITDPRQPGKVSHDLVELLVVEVNAVLTRLRRSSGWHRRSWTGWAGTQPNIARTIRQRRANYILAVKDNHPKLAESMREFFASFQAAPGTTPHTSAQTLEKDHGRLKTRRCYAFDQLDCLYKPEQWPELKSFVVLESERQIKGKTSIERRLYLSSLPADAQRLLPAIRAHWSIENRLHWCMDAAFADDQMRARSGHAHTILPSSNTSRSISSASIPSHERGASRPNDSSPSLPMFIVLIWLVLCKIRTIALQSTPTVSSGRSHIRGVKPCND